MGRGSTNKRKGSNAERYYAKVFKEDLGFSFCKTSRNSSKLLDDAGIDLNFLPFNVQIKAGYNKGLNETKTLLYIEDKLKELFPPYDAVHDKANVLIHKKDVGRGKKSTDYHELVFIKQIDFFNHFGPLLTLKTNPPKLKSGQKRGWDYQEFLETNDFMYYRSKMDKDTPTLAVMTFNTFKKLVKQKVWL